MSSISMPATPSLYLQIVDLLLNRHFAIGVNDIDLDEAGAENLMSEGKHPYQVINAHAEDCDLVRTDLEGFYFVPEYQPLSEEHEMAATEALLAPEVMQTRTSARRP